MTADQGEPDGCPAGARRCPRVLRQVTRRELDAVTEDPVGRRPERRTKIRRQPGVGNHVELSVHIMGNNCPARRGNPVIRLPDQPLGDVLGIERFVGFTDGLDNGVAMLETSPEGAKSPL